MISLSGSRSVCTAVVSYRASLVGTSRSPRYRAAVSLVHGSSLDTTSLAIPRQFRYAVAYTCEMRGD